MRNDSLMSLDVVNLSKQQRFELIHRKKIKQGVYWYLKQRMKNLSIEIGGGPKGSFFELMNQGLLEGWCWQTTESAIVFLNDDDYIERGNLIFGIRENVWFPGTYTEKYWHSWICFSFNNIMYVFDPCLQIIIEKDIYHHIFEIKEIAGSVTAKSVKKELIDRINYHNKHRHNYLPYFSVRQMNETLINGNDDVSSPMYRNGTGYTATFNNGMINTLIAHYYYNG